MKNKKDELIVVVEKLLAVLNDKNACGTYVDRKWMGVPDWELVEEVEIALYEAKLSA